MKKSRRDFIGKEVQRREIKHKFIEKTLLGQLPDAFLSNHRSSQVLLALKSSLDPQMN